MIKLPDFILIPYQLLEDKEISLIDERLYGIIYWFTKLKNEKCTASNTTLADLIKSNHGTVGNSLTKLESKGYIKRIFTDKTKKKRKEIVPLVVFSKVPFKSVSPTNDTFTNDTVSPTNESGVSPTNEQNKNIYNKNNKEDISKTSFAGKEVNQIIELFKSVNPSYEQLFKNKTQRGAVERLLKKLGREKFENGIKILSQTNNEKYAPTITTPLQFEEKLGALISFVQKQKNNKNQIIEI